MNNLSDTNNNRLNSHIPNHFMMVLVVCLLLLGVCVFASLTLGSRLVGFDEVIVGLFHPDVDSYGANVVRKRISRTIFCLFCGAALGVSGALMQAVTRNPI